MNRPPRSARSAHPARAAAPTPPRLHPRNRHQGRYDFAALLAACPDLRRFLLRTPAGETSIDFADPQAVLCLNRALLASQYGLDRWTLPAGFLCPPVPGRADYLHGLADLLAEDSGGALPRGPGVRVLDVGVGANAIYPLLGQREYGWRFVGSEVDAAALRAAQANIDVHGLQGLIELRRQRDPRRVFAGVLGADERFALSLCNPPFHASAAEAASGSRRKWRNLGRADAAHAAPRLNFGGRASELWCAGGEAGFLRRMADESAQYGDRFLWFSSLLARSEHLSAIRQRLRALGAVALREVPMAQGSKQSRFVAWSFLGDAQRQAALRASGAG